MNTPYTNDYHQAMVISVPYEGKDYIEAWYQDVRRRSHETDVKVTFHYFQQSLRLLQELRMEDLPKTTDKNDFINATLEMQVDGETYKHHLKLIKKLEVDPVYELRLSLREFNLHFRATFFPKVLEHQLYYCFVFIFYKVNGQPDPTDTYRDKTFHVSQNMTEEAFRTLVERSEEG